MNLIDGIPVIEFPILVSSVGVAIGIFLIWFTLKNVKQRISKRDIIYDMEIFFGDRRIKIKALLDTGNMLKDPLTQKSVVVATKRCLKKILPEELFMDMETILGGDRIGKIKEFEDACAAVLSESRIELKKNEALNYLADVNMITRRSYKDLDTAMRKATQIRNRKE